MTNEPAIHVKEGKEAPESTYRLGLDAEPAPTSDTQLDQSPRAPLLDHLGGLHFENSFRISGLLK